jgi:chlorobactene glucosyltransferase
MYVILLYQYTITVILLFILINFLINNILFKNTSKYKLPSSIIKDNPLISVLVPARNEEENIKKCIVSLTKQDYKNIEILVLDDNSTDNTANIIRKLSKKYSNVKFYKGEHLRKGWLGKSFACHQLSKHARGKYMIFTDADTLHFPDSISSAVACLERYKVDALSVFPMQIMVTMHERMMVPFGNYIILALFPLYLMRKVKNAMFCTAIGQFMMFKSEVYRKIGGHKSIKGKVLEDVKISKHVKKSGYKFMIFDGRSNLYCRMYKSFRDVVRGYSRVLFAAFDYNIFMMSMAIVLIAAVFLGPFIMLPLGIIFSWPALIIEVIILQVVIVLTTRIVFAIRFKCRSIDILLHPVAMFYLLFIAVKSILDIKYGDGMRWKGRVYTIDEEDELRLVSDNYK